MARLRDREFRRILIIKPSSFGDVIHALPVLNGLRHRYPHAHISWLVADSCAGLLEGHPALDEIIRFDRKRYGQIARNPRATLEFIQFIQDLRSRRFDLIVDLQGLFRSGFLALVTGARNRVGFANARELGWIFYNHRVDVPDADMHAVDRNYLFGRMLGFTGLPIRFDLPVRPQTRETMIDRLAREGIPRGEDYLVVGPGTRWETKQWPAEHFAAAIRAIAAEHGLPVVLTGMPEERQIAERVAAEAGGRVVNLAGQTSLPEMIALVDGARAVLMHDSGPMHLATALNKPLVAIYGPTSPARTGPYGRGETVARLDLPCSPCYLKRVADCPHGHRCLRELRPEAVAAQVSRTLAASEPSACGA
ncbi:MAG TPA: lipopolysaccharide heptosyltransferase I [Phycisphaerae bacterium]|nr:lipopolysaccharide heptosyltransferase I [Phycisphaerae bacterium]HOM52149.1 lipopolysaccharide heptosyltransferase I [Phycisphaerae bacterium]HON67166.1 lipopolysaccharide heptosyltransferase I [Phycisphaerae bacterium]HOQ86667.1 lipopolysaccharide heptosyltransferase I [Phycisphaerae bacterium]HPP27676.1 lipopolysaccharide heptosyltransferase I [Phycisphaerae bacterium]